MKFTHILALLTIALGGATASIAQAGEGDGGGGETYGGGTFGGDGVYVVNANGSITGCTPEMCFNTSRYDDGSSLTEVTHGAGKGLYLVSEEEEDISGH